MDRIVCDLAVPRAVIEAGYGGSARWLQVRARDGRSVRMPILMLRPWVAHDGVRGAFALDIDGRNRLQRVERLR